ncbi:MAG: hypothetical protein JRI23_35865 [Deltaproteobacteria bacterium]|jgi:hypothetical protein|nr:hypothetical protein [Deltaproteobacteria bacterium]MBW2537723.1 hypothetical protein [Deltaproteobacteria bacterium]
MGSGITDALRRWLPRHDSHRQAVYRQTRVELDRLLGTELASGADAAADLDDLVARAGAEVDRLSGPMQELAAFLTPDRQAGGASLVVALAEILFVPRQDRTEYRDNRLASPPWDIRRLLLEYAVWSMRLDEEATALTRHFCAEQCHRLPVGCCTIAGYDMGVTPEAMLKAQELEARLTGWTQRVDEENRCRYHGPTGCCLRRFKAPACTGMLCDPLVAHLQAHHGGAALDRFRKRLAQYSIRSLDRALIFEAMQSAVEAARRVDRGLPEH